MGVAVVLFPPTAVIVNIQDLDSLLE